MEQDWKSELSEHIWDLKRGFGRWSMPELWHALEIPSRGPANLYSSEREKLRNHLADPQFSRLVAERLARPAETGGLPRLRASERYIVEALLASLAEAIGCELATPVYTIPGPHDLADQFLYDLAIQQFEEDWLSLTDGLSRIQEDRLVEILLDNRPHAFASRFSQIAALVGRKYQAEWYPFHLFNNDPFCDTILSVAEKLVACYFRTRNPFPREWLEACGSLFVRKGDACWYAGPSSPEVAIKWYRLAYKLLNDIKALPHEQCFALRGQVKPMVVLAHKLSDKSYVRRAYGLIADAESLTDRLDRLGPRATANAIHMSFVRAEAMLLAQRPDEADELVKSTLGQADIKLYLSQIQNTVAPLLHRIDIWTLEVEAARGADDAGDAHGKFVDQATRRPYYWNRLAGSFGQFAKTGKFEHALKGILSANLQVELLASSDLVEWVRANHDELLPSRG